jgi:integrase
MKGNPDMVLLRLRYVMSDTDRHGTRRHYFRRHGRKVRLPGLPGSQEFMDAYQAALQGGKTPDRPWNSKADPKSLRALLDGFYRSVPYRDLDARSQRVRQSILEAFAADKLDKPYRMIERRHVLKWRDAKSETPGAATNLVKALRSVFSYAVDYGLMTSNPAMSVPYLRKKNGGFHTWTIDEVQQFEAHYPVGTKPRLAMALLFYTGQRRSDIVTFGKQMVRDGRLHYVQKKTGKRMATKIIGPLQQIIDATPATGLTFLETHKGLPYTSNGFGNAFREWCNEAGLPHCSAHGLRKALAARLAELGASASRIQNALGHESLSEASRYTKGADSEAGSDAALELFENSIAPLSGSKRTRGAKR